MMKFSGFAATVVLAVVMVSCGAPKKAAGVASIEGFTQGTVYNVKIKGDTVAGTYAAIESLLDSIERSMSLYDSNSLICRLNRNETDSVDRFIAECIAVARRISEESGGLYDITIKPLTGAYGFAGNDAEHRIDIDSLLQFVGYRKISVRNGRLVKDDPRVQIDLNSIAQGLTADIIAEYLDRQGFKEYLVNIGQGEIFAKGTNASGKPWTIGIDRPAEGNMIPGQYDYQGKFGITGRGLATSGNYRKFYVNEDGEKIVHTVNPLTGKATESNLLSATVVATDATLADAYGTMLMVMGLEESIEFLKRRSDLDAFLVYAGEDGEFRTYSTPGMEKMEIK